MLRETGLITTRRLGSSVLHTVTPLGTALLGGQPLDVLPFTAVRDARGAGSGAAGRAVRGRGPGRVVTRAFRTA